MFATGLTVTLVGASLVALGNDGALRIGILAGMAGAAIMFVSVVG